MKTKLKLYAVAPVLALSCSSAALALPSEPVPTRTVVIQGSTSGPMNFEQETGGTITVRVVEEPNPNYLVYDNIYQLEYQNVTKEISVEVRDELGELVFEQTHVNDATQCEYAGGEAEFEIASGESESYWDSAEWSTVRCETEGYPVEGHFVFIESSSGFILQQEFEPIPELASLFETWGNYPTLRTGERSFFMFFGAEGGEMRLESQAKDGVTAMDVPFQSFFTFAEGTSIDYEDDDSDGDGVSDEVDLCSASITDETVIFGGWANSGVTNYVDASGCTIMDRYAACQQEVEEQPTRFSRFQPRYSGPSYCEKQVSYSLVDEGIIDYAEARMLRDALYMSYRSQPR